MNKTMLQLRLESGEPKCANCKAWDQNEGLPTFGICQRTMDGVPSEYQHAAMIAGTTTDLTVCSKWDMK